MQLRIDWSQVKQWDEGLNNYIDRKEVVLWTRIQQNIKVSPNDLEKLKIFEKYLQVDALCYSLEYLW